MARTEATSTEGEMQPAQSAELSAPLSRGHLYVVLSLVVIVGVFVYGVVGWVRFYQVQGGPVGLFTNTDYPAITIASHMVASGQGGDLYDLNLQLEGQRRLIEEAYVRLSPADDLKYPYPYTPVIAVLWSPSSGLSPLSAMALWDLLNLAAMAFGLWYLLSVLPLPKITRLLVLLAALTSFPFIVNLEQGQSSGLVMLGLGVGLGLLRRGHDLPGGMALGLLALKLQWLPLVAAVLLFKGRWRALLGIAATTLLLLLIVFAAIGPGWVRDYVSVVARAQSGAREFLLDPWYSHSLTGALTALFGRGAEGVIRLVTPLVSLILLLVLVERWRPGTAKWDGFMALTLLTTMLASAHLNTHDLCLLALPAALGLSFIQESSQSERTQRLWYSLLWAAYLITALPPGAVFAMPVRLTTLVMAVMLGFLAVLLVRQPDVASLRAPEAV
jgi:hypothetical protein